MKKSLKNRYWGWAFFALAAIAWVALPDEFLWLFWGIMGIACHATADILKEFGK